MEISYTRLRVYLECPWKYKLMFVEGRRVPLTPPSSLGLSLHRALECFHRKDAGALEDLLDCYDDRWLGAGYPDEQTKDLWYLKGRRILERYHVAEQDRRSKVVGVEREFIYPLGGHTVRGMVDRIDRLPDGRHEVIDYKTHLDIESEEGLADDLQMRFYALGAKESLALEPSLLTLYYVAAGKKVSVVYESRREPELKALIERTADAIEAGRFAPDPAFCPRCEFRKDCALSSARD
jgi:RecB family exonuclease